MSGHEFGEYQNFIIQMARIGMMTHAEARLRIEEARGLSMGPAISEAYRGLDFGQRQHDGTFHVETMYSEDGRIHHISQPHSIVSEGHDYLHEQSYVYYHTPGALPGALGSDGSILIKIGNDYSEI